MNNLKEITNIFNNLELNNDIVITKTIDPKWGDYQTNIAMMYFKEVKQKLNLKNPKEFGNYIIEQMNDNINISKMEIAGPGFINITLSDSYLVNFINKIIEGNQPIFNKIDDNQKVLVDYSSPNIAKEMHVGHLRSTIIGDVIGNFFQLKGYQVERINHIGDWGTQFGMLIAYIQNNNINLEDSKLSISDLHIWYKESKKIFDSNAEFNKLAHQNVVKLQRGSKEHLNIWKKICLISESSYQEIYHRLNISEDLKIYGESFYNNMLEDLVTELKSKNLLIFENGAELFFVDEKSPPLIVKKSDGGFGYDATDLAAVKYRIEKMNADKIIYVTDSGQSLHFEMLFKAAKLAGWVKDDLKNKLIHVPFGVVLGEDGKKIKSRSGTSVKLTELLDEANKIYLQNNMDRKKEDKCMIKDESIEKISKIIGWNAVKYSDLKHNRNNNYQFDYQKMLDFKGDTLIYQLYAWVRLCNLFRKTNYSLEAIKNADFNLNNNITERNLLIHLTQFDEVCEKVLESLLPNYLCEYIYQLSIKINDFWRDCHVIGDINELSRLKLCLGTKIVMKSCFNLLKISVDQIERL
jgi:arginyl-tRNA synthetase